MDSETLADTLEEAGLSPYQAAAYVTVLELGTASATDVADASEVPGPRIYDVLAALADRGYVETYEQDTLRVRAHSPAEVLSDLRERSDRFADAAAEIEERWEQPELESNRASIVKRFETVIDRARLFIEDAENQIHVSASPEDLAKLHDPLSEAYARGVAIDLIVHTDVDEDPPPRSEFVGTCREARHRAVPTPFVALVDRRKTCFSQPQDSFDQYGVLVNDRTHTYVFHWFFTTFLWENADLVYTERTADPPLSYVDIRRLLRETQPLFESAATVTVRVEGYDTATGDRREFTGTVADARSAQGPGNADPDPQHAGQVMLAVDTGDDVVTVGGWGAVLEDVEAERIVVESVEGDDADARLPGERR